MTDSLFNMFNLNSKFDIKEKSIIQKIAFENKLKAVSLFSSAGIGELGLKSTGIDLIAANEIIEYRSKIHEFNFQNCKMFKGDINKIKNSYINFIKNKLDKEELFLLYATPPCQGMSSNGMGRLKLEIDKGNRKRFDERNQLIVPTIEIIKELNPRWIIIENVPKMKNTIINYKNESIKISEFIARNLPKEYIGTPEIIACEDYGIPQTRKRLISIYTKDQNAIAFFSQNNRSFFYDDLKERKINLREAIGNLPKLDAVLNKNSNKNFHEYHYVPIMNKEKYFWISNTKEGSTAYNNQCINLNCQFKGNIGHKDIKKDGKWQASKDIPINCLKCGEPLPRPTIVDKKTLERRILKGFHSAYRRMSWDKPASAITQNFIYEASDNKVHPDQNRVLSIYEAMIIQTLDKYDFKFNYGKENLSTPKIAEILGESVPPYLIEKIGSLMISLTFFYKRKT